MSENVIVKAKIKDIAKEFNVAGDVAEALNKKVVAMIREGCERAKANKRSTLMGKDI